MSAALEHEELGHDTTLSCWQPLEASKQEVRLLVLHQAADPEEQLSCELRPISLRDEPTYEALSYCWGGQDDKQNILLHGQEYRITRNLFNALKAFRHSGGPRLLWVDAICINQLDSKERASQVTMMGAIYSSASVVRVWLSDEDYDTSLDFVLECANNPTSHIQDWGAAWKSQRVLRLDWWKRSWTVQEAILARELVFHVGRRSINLKTLASYHGAMCHHFMEPPACCAHVFRKAGITTDALSLGLNAVQGLLRYRTGLLQNEVDFMDVVDHHRNREATDPRDKMYAFVGLVDHIPEDFVSYEVPVEQCYVDCAAKLISESKSLDLLRYVFSPTAKGMEKYESFSKGLVGLPTWCPDWSNTMPSTSSMLSSARSHAERSYAAARSTNAKVSISATRHLEVSGLVWDTIRAVGECQDSKGYMMSSYPLSWSVLLAACLREDGLSPPEGVGFVTEDSSLSPWIRKEPSIGPIVPGAPGSTIVRTAREGEGGRSLPKICLQHQPPSFSIMIEDDPVQHEEHEAVAVLDFSSWDQLYLARYPGSEDETFQDAFRLCLLNKEDVGFDTSKRLPTFLRNMLNKVIFIKFWDRNVEDRATRLFASEEDQRAMLACLPHIKPNHLLTIPSIIGKTIDRRSFLISQTGYIGLGPARAQEGDLICVLHGCRMPCILRKHVSENVDEPAEWDFIGCAYIHGLMDGEAIDKEEAGELTSRTFRMR